MATGAQTWSTTAASNNSIDTSVNWAEGMAPSSINDSARAEMASAAMFIKDNAGTLATSGTTAAYTVTSKQVSTAVTNGYTVALTFHATNDSAATLNVDGTGAKALQLYNGTNVSGGELAAGSIHRFTYVTSSTAWVANDYFTVTVGLQSDGSVGAPSCAFSADTDTGLYRIGANDIGIAAGGVKVTDISTTTFAITDALTVSGAATLSSSLTVAGNALFSGTGTITGATSLSSNVSVAGSATVTGTLGVTGAATLSSSLAVTNASLFSSGVTIAGGATLQSSLAVTGPTLLAALTATSATLSSSLNVSGATQVAALTASGKVTASSSMEVSNATLLSSALTVAGGATLSSTLHVAGAVSVGGAATVTGALSGASVTGSMVATQADQETGTSTTIVVSPGRQHFHPGHPKCWAYTTVSAGTPTLQTSYNITSVTDDAVGKLTITIATDFSAANWASNATVSNPGAGSLFADISSKAAGTIQIESVAPTGPTNTDP